MYSTENKLLVYNPSDPNLESMINVEDVSMVFNIASERLNNLKEYAIAFTRRELRFKEFRALDNISLDVKRGDVFGLLGTNGSGKSTLLKIIAGVLDPSEGTCTVKGTIAPLIELGAGFDLELTARENIYLNGALLGYSKKFIQDNFDDIVTFAEVEQFLDMPLKNYSSGMVARIAFAIATVIVPDILIVDEVLSVGDFMFQQKCEQRIQSLIKEHGVTVLIVSHSNAQIERLCNKAAWIEKGRLRAMGDAKDVCHVYRAIGGRTGSLEAERLVLQAAKSTEPIPPNYLMSIFADDRYGTSCRLNATGEPQSKVVFFANDAAEAESRIAVGLAGLLDAHFFTSRADRLSDTVANELRRIKPTNCIVFGNEKAMYPELLDEISSLGADVIRLEERPSGLSTYKYANDLGLCWGDTAILASDKSEHTLLSLAPFIFRTCAPTFYPDKIIDNDAFIAVLQNFQRIILATSRERFELTLIKTLEKKDVDLIEFAESDPQKASTLIDEWLKKETALSDLPFDQVLITSPKSDIDNRPAGPLVGRMGLRVHYDDPYDLDSFAKSIDHFKRRPRPKNIWFLGNEARFNTLYRESIGRAALV